MFADLDDVDTLAVTQALNTFHALLPVQDEELNYELRQRVGKPGQYQESEPPIEDLTHLGWIPHAHGDAVRVMARIVALNQFIYHRIDWHSIGAENKSLMGICLTASRDMLKPSERHISDAIDEYLRAYHTGIVATILTGLNIIKAVVTDCAAVTATSPTRDQGLLYLYQAIWEQFQFSTNNPQTLDALDPSPRHGLYYRCPVKSPKMYIKNNELEAKFYWGTSLASKTEGSDGYWHDDHFDGYLAKVDRYVRTELMSDARQDGSARTGTPPPQGPLALPGVNMADVEGLAAPSSSVPAPQVKGKGRAQAHQGPAQQRQGRHGKQRQGKHGKGKQRLGHDAPGRSSGWAKDVDEAPAPGAGDQQPPHRDAETVDQHRPRSQPPEQNAEASPFSPKQPQSHLEDEHTMAGSDREQDGHGSPSSSYREETQVNAVIDQDSGSSSCSAINQKAFEVTLTPPLVDRNPSSLLHTTPPDIATAVPGGAPSPMSGRQLSVGPTAQHDPPAPATTAESDSPQPTAEPAAPAPMSDRQLSVGPTAQHDPPAPATTAESDSPQPTAEPAAPAPMSDRQLSVGPTAQRDPPVPAANPASVQPQPTAEPRGIEQGRGAQVIHPDRRKHVIAFDDQPAAKRLAVHPPGLQSVSAEIAASRSAATGAWDKRRQGEKSLHPPFAQPSSAHPAVTPTQTADPPMQLTPSPDREQHSPPKTKDRFQRRKHVPKDVTPVPGPSQPPPRR
ncbi:hypothetical protein C8Q74DRAFT_1370561 [Fomes fomentarius]|nr:hypothetical protein C8Q74DRAFT_1370561 [Fomes fomentarius]